MPTTGKAGPDWSQELGTPSGSPKAGGMDSSTWTITCCPPEYALAESRSRGKTQTKALWYGIMVSQEVLTTAWSTICTWGRQGCLGWLSAHAGAELKPSLRDAKVHRVMYSSPKAMSPFTIQLPRAAIPKAWRHSEGWFIPVCTKLRWSW